MRRDIVRAGYDAICSFYAVIHVPREEHRPLLGTFRRMLRPGGLLLLCTGAGEWEGVEEFLGSPMYWSHYDSETTLRMLEEMGFHTLRSEILPDSPNPENVAHHLFLLAEKREVRTRMTPEINQ